MSDETPHRLFASDHKVQELEKAVSATRLTISSLCDRGFQPPQSLLDPASSLSRDLEDAKRSSSELRGEILPPTSQPGVSSHLQRLATATPVQPGPSHPEGDPASAGPSRRRSYDSPSGSFGRSSSQGSDTAPHKRRRLSDDSSADGGESSSSRRQRDDQQEDEENFRPASLALLLDYIMKKFPASSKPLAQPSSRRFHVFETAGLVDESSPRSSNLAWFDHMRSACELAQSKFESRIFEGRSLSTLMPSVSRTEKVSDSPCQGKGLKVNSQVYDLMSSRPSDSRSVPLSVREATVLETTLRSMMESYNFQLWTTTALFRFLGESGHFNLEDPLLDQFQRSFSRGTENVAAAMASAVAFVTTKRRESFLSHMVPSERRPRSASCCRILSSNRRISLRLPPSRRLVMRQEMSPCIGEPSLGFHVVWDDSAEAFLFVFCVQRSYSRISLHTAALPSIIFFETFSASEEVVRSPEETWGFSEVGVCPLAQHRRLSGPFLASMGGSGSGCLGRGGLARGIQDPFLPTTSFVRPTPPHAILYPVFHQGKSLGAGVPGSLPQTRHRTGSSDSRLLQSPICGPEGFRGVAPHHRPVYPEHLHRFPAISHGDSSVRPPFHSPRRLDDLLRSAGRIPPSSDPSGIASVSSLHHGRSPLSVQGAMLRADDCPSGLYTADGSNIRHSPSLRYQDAQISRQLVDPRRIQDHLYPG